MTAPSPVHASRRIAYLALLCAAWLLAPEFAPRRVAATERLLYLVDFGSKTGDAVTALNQCCGSGKAVPAPADPSICPAGHLACERLELVEAEDIFKIASSYVGTPPEEHTVLNKVAPFGSRDPRRRGETVLKALKTYVIYHDVTVHHEHPQGISLDAFCQNVLGPVVK